MTDDLLFRPDAGDASARATADGFRDVLHEILGSFRRQAAVTSSAAGPALAERFLATAVPEPPLGLTAYAEFLRTEVVPHSVNLASPQCLGHMSGAVPPFVAALAEFIAELNQNVVRCDASRILTLIERQTIAILHRLVYARDEPYYAPHVQAGEGALGIVTSGGTLANLTALWRARNASFPPHGGFAGVEADGLAAGLQAAGETRAVIVGSDLLHYSVGKAAGVLGLGAKGLIGVPVDGAGRIALGALRDTLSDCAARRWRVIALVAAAGSTDCGSIDPLAGMAELAARHRLPLHVDGAWGGALLLSRRHRDKLDGIAEADSVTLDGHKLFGLPLGLSVLTLRDPAAARVLRKEAHYILRKDSTDLGRFTLEGSRPANILYLHAALHVLGARGYEAMIDRGLSMAARLAECIAARPDFELLQPPETNIVLYRYLPPRLRQAARSGRLGSADQAALNTLNEALQHEQYVRGNSLVARTLVRHLAAYPQQPVLALRAVVANPAVSLDELEHLLDEQAALAEALEDGALTRQARA